MPEVPVDLPTVGLGNATRALSGESLDRAVEFGD